MAGEADSRDLWGEALGQLSEEDRRVIEESQLAGNRLETLDHIRRAAEQEKQRCIEKGWSVYTTTSGKKIKLRHVLEKISAWVSELINVVNVAVAFDASGNAAAPWGVAATSNIAVFTDLGEGIELTTRLITRNAVIERLYLHDDVETTPHLTKHITEMYVSVLCYLSAAKKYFESGTIKKVGHGIRDFLTKEYKSLLDSISEVEVEKWLRTADHLYKDAAERHRILKETLNRLDQPIMQMAVQLSAMQDQLDYGKRIKVFQWMSEIPYGSHFEQNSKSLPEDSGHWLPKSREFSDWSLSNESCVFWLSGPLLKRLRRNSLYAGNACPIAFFYCSRNTIEPERADPDKILGALVKQLSGTEPSETIREPVAIEYNRRKAVADVDGQKPKPLDVEDCTKLITQLCNVNPAFVLVDALDECDESRLYELLESLDQITHHIQLSKVIRSRIVPEKNCQDINTFIEMEVLRLHSKKLLLGGQISPKLRRKTIKKLQSGASGMFRWVTLSLETLSSSSIKHPKD
ncbi:ankyrin repeat protein [Colletotrichum plurivorum]|uniref:Ankyrin repeat protein n=1 Tax=Colletotrichum plurivorum TaxID=2175906 RepID=A0A8H6NDT9_9PEZI|nr:ankyrin repeat protein [Colletotrichum plurivorum]